MKLNIKSGNTVSDLASTFVKTFRIAARQVGSVSRLMQGEISLQRKSGDSEEGTALTAVDLAAQEVILHLLHVTLPGLGVDAEEETPTAALFPPENGSRPLAIIDPIDGTFNYYRGSNDYAVMAALCLKELYRAAVVYFPATDTMYWTAEEGSSFRQRLTEKEQRCTIERADNHLLLSPFVAQDLRRRLEAEGFTTERSRCSAVDALAPVSGRAAAAINSRLDRRGAIGFPITLAAGGTVMIDNLIWQGEDPANHFGPKSNVVVAGSAELAAQLSALLVS